MWAEDHNFEKVTPPWKKRPILGLKNYGMVPTNFLWPRHETNVFLKVFCFLYISVPKRKNGTRDMKGA